MITDRARSFISFARAGVVAITMLATMVARPLPIAFVVAALGLALWWAMGWLLTIHDAMQADFCQLAGAYQRAVEAQKRAVRSRSLTDATS